MMFLTPALERDVCDRLSEDPVSQPPTHSKGHVSPCTEPSSVCPTHLVIMSTLLALPSKGLHQQVAPFHFMHFPPSSPFNHGFLIGAELSSSTLPRQGLWTLLSSCPGNSDVCSKATYVEGPPWPLSLEFQALAQSLTCWDWSILVLLSGPTLLIRMSPHTKFNILALLSL